MLASITPLGERGRRQRWGVTVTAFVLGALLAAIALGAALGAAGALALGGTGPRVRLVVLAALSVAALGVERGARRIPGPRRQVDRRWLDEFRGWVYGAGFGAQLGIGVATIVASTTTYLALAAATLSGSARSGALILGIYGLGRGAQPLIAARVTAPDRLGVLHRRIARWAPVARRAGTLGVAGIVIGAAGAAVFA